MLVFARASDTALPIPGSVVHNGMHKLQQVPGSLPKV